MKAEFIPIPESEVSALGVLRQKAWASTYRGIYPDELIDQFDDDWHLGKRSSQASGSSVSELFYLCR